MAKKWWLTHEAKVANEIIWSLKIHDKIRPQLVENLTNWSENAINIIQEIIKKWEYHLGLRLCEFLLVSYYQKINTTIDKSDMEASKHNIELIWYDIKMMLTMIKSLKSNILNHYIEEEKWEEWYNFIEQKYKDKFEYLENYHKLTTRQFIKLQNKYELELPKMNSTKRYLNKIIISTLKKLRLEIKHITNTEQNSRILEYIDEWYQHWIFINRS